jgi:hypothetical protein
LQTAIKLRGLVYDITRFPDAEFHSERRDPNIFKTLSGKGEYFYRGSRTVETKEYTKTRRGGHNPG